MPIDRLYSFLQTTPGPTETGENYIVAGNHLCRGGSRFIKESMILAQSIRTTAVDQVLCSGSGFIERADELERSA